MLVRYIQELGFLIVLLKAIYIKDVSQKLNWTDEYCIEIQVLVKFQETYWILRKDRVIGQLTIYRCTLVLWGCRLVLYNQSWLWFDPIIVICYYFTYFYPES